MPIQILTFTRQQQAIAKMKVDGYSDKEIIEKLSVTQDDVDFVDVWVERGLTKRWKRTARECWDIIRRWNLASTLLLVLCIMPMLDDQDWMRARNRVRRGTKITRLARTKI